MTKKNGSSMAGDLRDTVIGATERFTKTIKAEEKNPAARRHRVQRMTRESGPKQKAAAAEIMEKAYLKASGNGQYPANARQIMYAARPHIQKATGQDLQSSYFTQTLLVDYLEDNPSKCADWDVAYDARGHFEEPHGRRQGSYGEFGLGTIEVRNYLAALQEPEVIPAEFRQARVKTIGPSGNFGAVLFIEKEGFAPLIERAQIPDRFDIAHMSTKGMSVVAARHLADEMCAAYDVPLLLMHDFDKSGFSISGTLQRSNRRYQFQNKIRVIDLGLTVEDVEEIGLEVEYQHHPKADRRTLERNMKLNGASDADCKFMFRDFDKTQSTRRVELNAMTSPQFVQFLERKLKEYGVKKIVPDREVLAEAFAEMDRGRQLQEAFEELHEGFRFKKRKVPADLEKHIRRAFKNDSTLRWDDVLAQLVDTTAWRTD
jgi:hypothetical protein